MHYAMPLWQCTHFAKTNIIAGPGAERKDSLVDKVKKMLRVDSDDTEELHNKDRDTSKDREEKIKLFEEQLNIMASKME
jgi:hypothetical protein